MAPRLTAAEKKPPRQPPPLASEQLESEEIESSARAMLKARAMIEEVKGEDVRMKLWRRDARTGKRQYITTLDSAVFDEDLIQREYGPGDYFFAAMGPKSAEHPTGYLGAASFIIGEATTRHDTPVVAAAPAEKDGLSMRELLAMMMAQNNALIAALAQRGNGGGGASEIVDAALKLAEMTRPPQSDPVAMILKGMEIAEGRESPGGHGGDFDTSLLEGIARPLAQIVEHQMGRNSSPTAASPTHEVSTMPRRPVAWQPVQDAPGWVKSLAPFLPVVFGMAKQGVSPRVVVDMIFDRADDATLDRIAGDCIAPNWTDETLAFLPPPFQTTYRTWTASLLNELKEELLAPDDDPGTDHPESKEIVQ